MESDAKRSCVGVDRISILPRHLIDHILERLPIDDTARLGVVSKTWNHIWGSQSQLVFEYFLFKKYSVTVTDISNILLLHNGPILKFCFTKPRDLLMHRFQDTDIWIKYLSVKGVKILELSLPPPSKFFNQPYVYKLPSYFFSCLELTDVFLVNCILHPPLGFGGFCNLKRVKLTLVTITADMSFGLQLEELKLNGCKGIEHLGCQFKRNNNLTKLSIMRSGAIDWRWFEYTQNVKELVLEDKCDGYINEKVVNFDKLVGNMPWISSLGIDSYFLQLLEPGATNSWKLTTTMENLEELYLYEIDFCNLHQIQYVLCLIQSLPTLPYLYLSVDDDFAYTISDDMEKVGAVEKCLQLPYFTGIILKHLQIVEIDNMAGSRAELQFIKFLLASTPSLRMMKLRYQDTRLDPKEDLRISQKLLQFTKASAAAQVTWNEQLLE